MGQSVERLACAGLCSVSPGRPAACLPRRHFCADTWWGPL